MSKTAKQKRRLERDGALSCRSLAVRADSIDVESRSVEAALVTETPVPMIDWDRYELIPEVLLMKGAELPESRQIPFLNCHGRWSITEQLGSARALVVKRKELIGRLFFSATAEDEWTKVREGHVTDVSVGYRVLEKVFVPKGTKAMVEGRQWTGPVNVVTRWVPREVSLVPIGADEQAKLRGIDPSKIPQSHEEAFSVNEELRQLWISRGMPAELDDEAAQAWALEHERANPPKPPAEKDPPRKPEDERSTILLEEVKRELKELKSGTGKAIDDALARAEKKRQEHAQQVRDLCELGDVPHLADELCRAFADKPLDETRAEILKRRKEGTAHVPPGLRIEPGNAQLDKHRGAVGTALAVRALGATGCRAENALAVFPEARRAAGWEQYRNASLMEIARACLEMDGIRAAGLSSEQIAVTALGWPQKVGVRGAGAAYHTTASFPRLTQDAVNMSMQVGYMEFPSTWEGPMRQGASVEDFKQIHRMRLGAIPNLPIWPDNTDPDVASLKDAEEKYAVEARSLEFSLSWRLMVNNQMDVLSRVPSMFGTAAARTVNAVAWAEVTGNPTMEDGQALFLETATGNRKRSNLTTGAGAPTVATLQTLSNKMMQMRGENTPEQNESQDILNLQPRYLVGPSALSTTVKQLILSAYDPAASAIQVYNTATELIPVIEPLLDANSATAWYVFASPSQIDTVEVTFLQGQESPVTRDWMDERTLSQCWAVLQTFAAKALQHRGIQKHAGA